MRFIVPIDFSDAANNTGYYASALAQATDSSIHLIHIVEPYIKDPNSAELEHEQKFSSNRLIQWQKSFQAQYPISISTEVKIGHITKEILLSSKQHKAHLIIMGTLGASGLNKLIWGSNTINIIENSSIPVLAVPENIEYSTPTKIVYATDFNNSDIDDLKMLSTLAENLQAKIEVIHITEGTEEADANITLEKYFSDLVKKTIPYSKISFNIIKDSSALTGIKKYLKDSKANIFALSIHKKNIFEELFTRSLTKEFVMDIKLPVLAFHVIDKENSYSEF